MPSGDERFRVSRRSFIQTLGASAAAGALQSKAAALVETRQPDGASSPPTFGPGPVDIDLKINGKKTTLKVEPATTLLEALRLHAGLTGSKEVCDRGSCGGCSVIIDGKLTVSCMVLAVDAIGSEITTVEGLAKGDDLDPIQAAFVKHDALQCGYCTPGFIVASRSLLNDIPKPTLDQIKHWLSGNICRCGTYTNIFNAVLEASGQPPVADSKPPALPGKVD
ncbi:MAG: (2Fe-2S)-binding protein [Phycisphaeraceae bacterium]|nr:(2Fe-2S)-binding protein [Phycisphaeraceae bacterium]